MPSGISEPARTEAAVPTLPSPPPTMTISKQGALRSRETISFLIRSPILLPRSTAMVAARPLAAQSTATRSLPRSIPSFVRLPLRGFNTTKTLIACKRKRDRRHSVTHGAAFDLLRQGVADRALDLDGPLHRRPRHHPVVMGRQAGELAGLGLHRIHKAPVEPKQMDVGDRIALECPLPAAQPQPALGDAEHLPPAFDADPASRVDRRGDERHPCYCLRLGFETALGPQPG